jgi:DNA-binding SARP family transcriptional activator/tetratricopeptide (TPR) repeat protein
VYHLQTFGDLQLTDADGNTVRYPAKGLLMLAYLYTRRPHVLTRHELANFLWSDADAELSGLNLRKLISRIRRIDGDASGPPFEILPNSIRLVTSVVSVDLEVLEASDPPLKKLLAITNLLQRGFLEASQPATKAIEDWIRTECLKQRQKLREALFEALPVAKKADHFRMLSSAGLYLLEKDPDDEPVRSMLRRLPGTAGAGATLGSGLGEREKSPPSQVYPSVRAPTDVGTRADRAGVLRPALPRLVLLPPTAHGDAPGLPLASALIEDVTIELCALRNVSIVAPHTADQIRRDSNKAVVVARHSISYLLDTRLSGEGLYAHLIYFPTDEILWASRFSMTTDTLPVQRRLIAQQLTSSVVRELGRNEEARLSIESSPEAYHSYLVGASLLGKLTLPHIRRARSAFKEALRHHPDFSPAFTGLARTYTSEWLVTAQGNGELLQLAEKNALKAVERDPSLPGGYRELGVTKLYLGDVDESVAALSLAEELSPHFADVIYSHADTLVHASRPKDALAKIERAMSLNPISPDAYLWCAAGAAYFLEQYEDAIAYVEAMKDRAPAHRIAAASCAMMGDRKRAQFYRQRAEALNPVFELEKWLAVIPFKEQWQKDLYREGLLKAGF